MDGAFCWLVPVVTAMAGVELHAKHTGDHLSQKCHVFRHFFGMGGGLLGSGFVDIHNIDVVLIQLMFGHQFLSAAHRQCGFFGAGVITGHCQ
jgi:hypothetical protein